MALRFFNTLTQELEVFHPQKDNTVRMYTCGPTVYNFVHIGNFRTFTFQDILRRWLRYRGYKLDHVMNITDVDDKIIANAAKEQKSIDDYTRRLYQGVFRRCRRPAPRAAGTRRTRHQAYSGNGRSDSEACRQRVYLHQRRLHLLPHCELRQYGKLSHNDFAGIRSGARVDVDEYDKADARDFVLWKARKGNERSWSTPFGDGRPGWHIECSAMAMSYLGETLDIHAGGVDLIFPHHENEIAQSESITGKPFARFWLHSEHLHIESQKMSKSLGNFYTLRDLLEAGYQPEAIRYLLASVPYRKKLNFTFEGLKAAAKSIERLRDFEARVASAKLPPGRNEAVSERSAARDSAIRRSAR